MLKCVCLCVFVCFQDGKCGDWKCYIRQNRFVFLWSGKKRCISAMDGFIIISIIKPYWFLCFLSKALIEIQGWMGNQENSSGERWRRLSLNRKLKRRNNDEKLWFSQEKATKKNKNNLNHPKHVPSEEEKFEPNFFKKKNSFISIKQT